MANRLDRYIEQQMQDSELRDMVEKELVDLELGIKIARLREQENLNQRSDGVVLSFLRLSLLRDMVRS